MQLFFLGAVLACALHGAAVAQRPHGLEVGETGRCVALSVLPATLGMPVVTSECDFGATEQIFTAVETTNGLFELRFSDTAYCVGPNETALRAAVLQDCGAAATRLNRAYVRDNEDVYHFGEVIYGRHEDCLAEDATKTSLYFDAECSLPYGRHTFMPYRPLMLHAEDGLCVVSNGTASSVPAVGDRLVLQNCTPANPRMLWIFKGGESRNGPLQQLGTNLCVRELPVTGWTMVSPYELAECGTTSLQEAYDAREEYSRLSFVFSIYYRNTGGAFETCMNWPRDPVEGSALDRFYLFSASGSRGTYERWECEQEDGREWNVEDNCESCLDGGDPLQGCVRLETARPTLASSGIFLQRGSGLVVLTSALLCCAS